MSGQKRITKVLSPTVIPRLISSNILEELGELLNSPPTGIEVSLPSESDIHKWDVVMHGPQESVFAVCSLPAISIYHVQLSTITKLHLTLTGRQISS